MERPLWITRAMIERAARAIYRCSGWDRKWNEIDPSGRRRYRKAAIDAIFAAHPNAIRRVRSKK